MIRWPIASLASLSSVARCLVVAAPLCLAACQTPYQPDLGYGGFSEQQIGPRTWEVRFRGNDTTTTSTVYNGLVLRCAQIAAAHGYRYFVLEGNADASEFHPFYTPDKVYVGRHGRVVGYEPGQELSTVAPGQIYRITLTNTLTKRKPMGDARAILAAHPELAAGPARIDY
ncbi:hypothetical protein [Ralstonia sp. NFACC01]|uniref:CC0125/CC1285 family lipoprotein n=1 Tax=Ralstonia sp. NFACC01 TaxID=1566294 RepID=UPI0008E13EBC|nr:hypothetical protein [Ralstonia sp. NFACC01]SFP58380.1 hypothetical protein SAMN03159417_02557 [Ralstonia sp. NFACC01]